MKQFIIALFITTAIITRGENIGLPEDIIPTPALIEFSAGNFTLSENNNTFHIAGSNDGQLGSYIASLPIALTATDTEADINISINGNADDERVIFVF